MMKLKDPRQRKADPNRRHVQIALRVSESEFERLAQHAKRYTDGNISALVRYYALNYVVDKKELA